MWIEYIFPGINAIASFTTIVILILRNNRTGIERSYILMSAIWFNWSVGTILTILWGITPFGEYLYWLKNISAFSMGPVWLIFCLYYTNNRLIQSKWTIKKVSFFIIPSLIMYIVSITNKYHGFFFIYDYSRLVVSSYKWGFVVHMCLQYFYILGGMLLVFVFAIKSRGYVRKRSFLIVMGLFIAQFLVVFYYISGLYKAYNDIDIAPSTFLVALLFILVASVKYKFLNILPMALPKIIQNLKEGVMIVDLEGKIASCNTALCNMLENFICISVDSGAKRFSEELLLKGYCDEEGEKAVKAICEGGYESITGEIHIKEGLYLQINYQPLLDKRELIGAVISFYDIAEHKALMKELSERNHLLYEANSKLLEHAQVVEELVTSRERNRFASEIHDSVGHSLSVLGALLEVCKLTFNEDSEAAYEKINTALSISKSTLHELREAVVNFSSPSVKGNNLLASIKSMVYGFEATGIRVDFTVQGNGEFPLHEKISNSIFNICREALTNALKHGEAKTVDIILQFNNDNIGLYIFDDGKGCTNIKKGMGLKGMENRVRQLNGSVSFGSGGDTGFSIHVQIPLTD